MRIILNARVGLHQPVESSDATESCSPGNGNDSRWSVDRVSEAFTRCWLGNEPKAGDPSPYGPHRNAGKKTDLFFPFGRSTLLKLRAEWSREPFGDTFPERTLLKVLQRVLPGAGQIFFEH